MSVRTFLAIGLPSDMHFAIGQMQNELKRKLPLINWVKSGNLHVTLKFLGDTPESKIDELEQVVAQAVRGLTPFGLNVKGFGAFPNPQAPRSIWIGIEGDENALANLVLQVEASVIALGFPKEVKPFRPHLTLARIKREHQEVGQAIEKAGVLADPFLFGRVLVEQVTLFKSDLRPTGSVYSPLWAVPLANS